MKSFKIKIAAIFLLTVIFLSFLLSCNVNSRKSNSQSGQAPLRSVVSIKVNDTAEDGSFQKSYDATGIIHSVDKDGGAYIITNCHVVKSEIRKGEICSELLVSPYGNKQAFATATCIGNAEGFDIAVIYCAGLRDFSSGICGIEKSVKETVRICESIVAVGNARGKGISAVGGTVSLESEYIKHYFEYSESFSSIRQIRISASLFEGCSGGGIFDLDGNFCGLINSRLTFEGVSASVGYAIPASTVMSVSNAIVSEYKNEGEFVNSINTLRFGADFSEKINDVVWDEEQQILFTEKEISVAELNTGSLASAFLKCGDIITSVSVNGRTYKISEIYQITEAFYCVRAGDEIEIEYKRDGQNEKYRFSVDKANIITLE